LQIANHKIRIPIPIKVGGHHGTRIKVKPKPRSKVRVDESVLFTGKEPVDFSSGKALSLIPAGALRAASEEIFIVFVFSKEPILFGRERIDIYFFTRFLRDSDDNLSPVKTSQIFGSGARVVAVGLVDVLVAI
jgi:hypothetical protein